MKTVEKYLQLGLAVILGFCFYLGASIYDRTFALGNDIEQIPAFTKPETNELKYEQPKIDNNEIFLVAYKNESISMMRNIFRPHVVLAEAKNEIENASIPLAMGGEEVIIAENNQTGYSPSKNTKKTEPEEEPLPKISMKGVVLSDNKQAVILDLDGKIQILTSQQPLTSGIKLVKVSKEETIVEYQGREIKLKF